MKVALVGDYDATVVAHQAIAGAREISAPAFELSGNRFFTGTAGQPERISLQQVTHPLITAFLMAAL